MNLIQGVFMVQVNIWVEKETRDEIAPHLKREGMSISSFLRKAMMDYLDAKALQDNVLSITEMPK